MNIFQKFLILFLFVVFLALTYYFFVFTPDRKKKEQQRIEQIKADCFKDTKWKAEFLSAAAEAKGVPSSAPEAHLSPSEWDHVYKLCLHQHGL